ncbi:hypothetical protein V6S63_12515, partial [Lactococcus lactis]
SKKQDNNIDENCPSIKSKIRDKYYIRKDKFGDGFEIFTIFRLDVSNSKGQNVRPPYPMTNPYSSLEDAKIKLESIIEKEYIDSIIESEIEHETNV